MVKRSRYLSNFPVNSSQPRPTHIMKPSTMIEVCFHEKYFDFTGRASRSEFGFFTLISSFLGILTNIVLISVGSYFGKWGGITSSVLAVIVTLIFLIPFLTVSTRRLHDIGNSGWYLLFIFLPLIGWYLLFKAYTREGSDLTNGYGKVPLNTN